MGLSQADILLLSVIRKRSRAAKYVIVLFAVKTLILASVAIWSEIEASRSPQLLADQDPMWPVALLLHQGQVFATAFVGLIALFDGVLSFFLWSQKKSDALTLKLINRASGYPTPS